MVKTEKSNDVKYLIHVCLQFHKSYLSGARQFDFVSQNLVGGQSVIDSPSAFRVNWQKT